MYKCITLRLIKTTPSFRNIQQVSLRKMSSTPQDPEITRLLDFWFEGGSSAFKRWFMGGESFDAQCRGGFLPLVERARAKELTPTWTTTPKGTLALLILLDQFPRNLYRGSPLSYATDAQARDVTVHAIATGVDRQLSNIERTFFYLPLMHHEDLTSQIACLALFEKLVTECKDGEEDGEEDEELKKYAQGGADMAKRHIVPILRFGRFPGRNKALGRESSEEERKFLEENPMGF